jgi:hypothetical protein
MANMFTGDNDHGDAPLPPLSDLLWEEVNKLRQEVVRLNNVIKELKALDQHSESVTTSHKSIITKHNDLFQKLAQDEKTNG